MPDLRNFSAKVMEEKLKRGWTTSDFSNHFQCSESEFIAHMQKTLSPPAFRGMSARLKRNEKQRPTPRTRTETPNVVVDNSAKSVEVNVEIKKAEETPVVNTPSVSETLEALEGKKETIEAILNEMELKHKALCSDRLDIRRVIAEYRERLVKLQQEVHLCQTDITSLVEQLDEKQASMQELNASISNERAKLAEVNAKIDTIKTIVIYAYSSGDIDIDAPFEIEIPEWKNKLNEFVTCDDAGSLTLNQLRALAKALTLAQFLDSQNWKYDIAFDNDEMEIFYLKIKS